MGRIKISPWARAQLAEIYNHIGLSNVDAADRFVDSAEKTFQELLRTPGMGPLRKFPNCRLDDLRSFRVRGFENYLIFYQSVPEGIEILNVLHGARDLDKFWKDE